MLNPCGTGGSTVVVTETADNVVIAVDGVPTLLPKYKNCNGAPLAAGAFVPSCDQVSQVTQFNYVPGTRELIIQESNLDTNSAFLPKATTNVDGLVQLATSADYPAPTNNVDAATPAYVKAAIDAIPAPPAEVNVDDVTYVTATRVLSVIETDGTVHPVTLPLATTTNPGLVELATAADYPNPTNDVDAVTPAFLAAAIGAIPAPPAVIQVTNYAYAAGTRALTITESNGDTHAVTLPLATTTNPGLVELATAADYPDPTNNVDAATPAYIQAAIDAIPADLLTPLANIAALTAADRGLSLGEVDIPTDRALTIAEMTAANSDNVGIPLVDMQSIYTNRAVEVTAPGLMNTNGTLGHAMRYSSAVGIAAVEAALITAVENNGSFVFASLTAGNTVVIPAPKYPGQVLEIRVALSGVYDEAILHFANQPSILGQYRNSQHKVTRGVGANDHIIIRSGETVRLTARSAAAGWDARHDYYNFSGSGWNEFSEGGALLDFEFSGTTTVNPGDRDTADFALPVTITSPLNLRPIFGDVNITGVATGSATNTDALFILRAEPDGNTTTTFRVSAFNVGTSAGALGRARAIGTAQSLDYAALGGIASF